MTYAAYADRDALVTASDNLADILNMRTREEIEELFADRRLDFDGSELPVSLAPDNWWEDHHGMYVVDRDGAAARRNTPGEVWVGIDPGPDVLTSEGLALWGSEGFGYPVG